MQVLPLLTKTKLFIHDDTSENASASRVATYYEGFGWYDGLGTRLDDPNDVPNQLILQAGKGYILRIPE